MGIMDAFKPEDRTEITYSNFYNLIKQAAQYEIVINAVNCDVPHRYIREAMTGEKEEEVAEMAQTAEGISMKFYGKEQLPAEPIKSGDFPLKAISLTPEAAATGQGIIYPTEAADRLIAEGKAVETKPIHGTRKRTIEKAKKKGTKNHGKNKPEI